MKDNDIKKWAILAAIVAVGVSWWLQSVNAQKKTAATHAAESRGSVSDAASLSTSDVPKVGQITQPSSVSTVSNPVARPAKLSNNRVVPLSRRIFVDTDVLSVEIDRQGGRIISAKLKKYSVSLKEKNKPTQLISFDPQRFFVAESGLTGKAGKQWSDAKALYKADKTHYVGDGKNPLHVNLVWRSPQGLLITKRWVFNPGKYVFDLNYHVKNQASKPWQGRFYAQIRHKKPHTQKSGLMRFNTYTGAAFFSPDKPYTKLSYKKMDEANLNEVIQGGWLSVQKHYFLTAWIPGSTQDNNHYFSHVDSGNIYTVGFLSPAIRLSPGQNTVINSRFYAGPEQVKRLRPLAKGLEFTVDYGWLWPISMLIMWIMRHIYAVIGNWGWSIILVTLLIKLLFFKFSESSYRSMAQLRKLQPRLERLKEAYGDDKQALSKATMDLYKKEKVNPMGGCLPFIIQIPFFIALYYVLIESVELRQAPFLLWIKDLSIKDPYFILPILMGVSMLLQQRMNPTSADPMQARMMYLLPVIFTVLFLNFPAGLVLYWLVNNGLSILQQWYITRRLSDKVSN